MHAVTPNSAVKIEGSDLYIGQMIKVPTSRISDHWVGLNNVVHIVCQSAKGPNYQGLLSLHLEADQIKNCIEQLIEKTSSCVSIPQITALKTEETKLAFTFRDQQCCDIFAGYYAPCFFSTQEFQHHSDKNTYELICTSDKGDTIAKIKQALERLDSRLYEHDIDQKLSEADDPRFPSKHYTKVNEKPTPLDVYGEYKRTFEIYPDEVKRADWTDYLKKEVPSSFEEVNSWINDPTHKHTPEESLRPFLLSTLTPNQT